MNEHTELIGDFQRQGETVVWAGDFNQSLTGSNQGGSIAGRDLLRESLHTLGLSAWNEHLAHAIPGLNAIDLICGPTKSQLASMAHSHG